MSRQAGMELLELAAVGDIALHCWLGGTGKYWMHMEATPLGEAVSDETGGLSDEIRDAFEVEYVGIATHRAIEQRLSELKAFRE